MNKNCKIKATSYREAVETTVQHCFGGTPDVFSRIFERAGLGYLPVQSSRTEQGQ